MAAAERLFGAKRTARQRDRTENFQMPSHLPQAVSHELFDSERRIWSKPAFSRLETGEAEGNDQIGPDGGQVS